MPVPADLGTLASLTRRDLLFLQRIADSATYSMIGREFGLCEASVEPDGKNPDNDRLRQSRSCGRASSEARFD